MEDMIYPLSLFSLYLLATFWPKIFRFAILECMFLTFSLRLSCKQLIQPSTCSVVYLETRQKSISRFPPKQGKCAVELYQRG